MNRSGVWLKSSNRPIPNREWFGFDTEDDSAGNVLQICFFDGSDFYEFTQRDDAIRWLYTLRRSVAIAATNLEYDLLNLFGHRLDLLDFRFKAAGSVIVSARLRKTRVRFYDTLNHSPLGVAKLGEYVGLPKLKMNLKSWRYVRRDTEITYRFVKMLDSAYQQMGCGMYATLPGSAVDLYRRRFLPFPIKQPPRGVLDFLYSGYYGGRTEVFNVSPQLGRVFYIDVNSMYPAVMRNPYPNPNEFTFPRRLPETGFGFARCSVKVPRSVYFPPLAHKTDRLLFPAGRFTGTWTFEELRRLEACGGTIERVHKVLRFKTSCYPFADYVGYLYPRKQNAQTEIDRYTAKILLNSLYGKFGERVEKTELVPVASLKPNESAIVYGEFAVVKRGIEFPNHTNVAWSAYTTAYARLLLQDKLEEIRAAGGLVLYCDTDSIVYKSDLPLHVDSFELGGWRLEGEYSFAHFLAPKLYSLEGDGKRIVHAKGVPRNYAPTFFDEGTATYSRPYRLRTILKKGLKGTFWASFTKRRISGYTKRRIFNDGETAPLFLKGDK